MTYNEIIKALECCAKNNCTYDCPFYHDSCIKCKYSSSEIIKFAFDTISHLKKENDDLFYKLQGVMWSVDKWLEGKELEQDEVNRAITMRERTLKIAESQQAEIERLNAVSEICGDCHKKYAEKIQTAKSEAIKEVLLTLEAEAESSDKYIREYDDSEVQRAYNKALWKSYNLVKEMVGDAE